MRLCNAVVATMLLVSAVSAEASGNVTQTDLDNIQRSRDIIENAKNDASLSFIDQSPNIDPRMIEELQMISKEAERMNDAIKNNQQSIAPEGAESAINFDELQKTIDQVQAKSRYQPGEISQPLSARIDDELNGFTDFSSAVSNSSTSQADGSIDGEDDQESRNYKDAEQTTIMWLFISSSMPDYEIKKTLEIAAEWGGRVVYRGLRPQDHSIGDMTKAIWKLKARLFDLQEDIAQQAQHPEDVERINRAGIYIDPMAFARFNVNEVPTMVYERRLPDNTKLIGKVKGLISGSYLQTEVENMYAEAPEKKDMIELGEMSAVYGIAERNLIDEIKDRTKAIDWARLQQEAVDRHFQNRKFYTLPNTTVSHYRVFDPSVKVTKDIKAKNGMVLAKAGEVFNPLKPYKEYDVILQHMTMFIFDATDPLEVEFVKWMAQSQSRGNIKLIATQIDKEEGFKEFKRLSDYLTYPVTLLTPDITERFALQSTPTRLMTTNEGMFNVDEYSRNDVVSWLKTNSPQSNLLNEVGTN